MSFRRRKFSDLLIITLEGIRVGGGVNLTPSPLDFFGFNFFFSLTDHQKLWYNGSLFVKRSFEPNYVTSS